MNPVAARLRVLVDLYALRERSGNNNTLKKKKRDSAPLPIAIAYWVDLN